MSDNEQSVLGLGAIRDLFQAGKNSEALKLLSEYVQTATDHQKVNAIALAVRFETKRGDAEVALRQLLLREPGNPALIRLLGEVLLQRGEVLEAENLFNRAVASALVHKALQHDLAAGSGPKLQRGQTVRFSPSHDSPGRIVERAASALLQAGRVDAAKNILDNAPKGSRRNEAKRKVLGSRISLLEGDKHSAKRFALEAAELKPDSREALELLAANLTTVAFVDHVQALLANSPSEKAVLAILGALRRLLKADSKSTAELLQVVSAIIVGGKPDARATSMGLQLVVAFSTDQSTRLQAAQKLFDSPQQSDPQYFIHLAKLLLGAGNISAHKVEQKALAVFGTKKFSNVLLFLGTAAAERKDFSDAVHLLQRAIDAAEPGSENAGKGLIQLADAFKEAGRIEDALKAFKRHYSEKRFALIFRTDSLLRALELASQKGTPAQLASLSDSLKQILDQLEQPLDILIVARTLLFASNRIQGQSDLRALAEGALNNARKKVLERLGDEIPNSELFDLLLELMRRYTDFGLAADVVNIYRILKKDRLLPFVDRGTAFFEFCFYVILALVRTGEVAEGIALGEQLLAHPALSVEGRVWIAEALARAHLENGATAQAKSLLQSVVDGGSLINQALVCWYWRILIAIKNGDNATALNLARRLEAESRRLGDDASLYARSVLLLKRLGSSDQYEVSNDELQNQAANIDAHIAQIK